ncbi:MAG: DNA ligase [Faecousia sp.]
MGRLSELGMAIRDLRSAAATINDVADTLAEMFSTASADEAPAAAAPAEPALTLEQVRAVLADKSRQGHTAEIRALLQKYGAAKLSGIDPIHYTALVAEAEVLTDAT